jgi:hypothetical protein
MTYQPQSSPRYARIRLLRACFARYHQVSVETPQLEIPAAPQSVNPASLFSVQLNYVESPEALYLAVNLVRLATTTFQQVRLVALAVVSAYLSPPKYLCGRLCFRSACDDAGIYRMRFVQAGSIAGDRRLVSAGHEQLYVVGNCVCEVSDQA